ncbi:unnamed protein product [Adineta steineri]|uniref:Uncharacterized protein n=1 Tax=Adineta steineri TaxID=433720 RepID=A0A818PGG0_9BILA|nr:unnamed protein product [Adineta steineri]
MIIFGLCFIILHLAYSQDICSNINCGSGVCILTQNPALPYFCRCPSGANTILPCPTENPCSRKPCGQGVCEVVPNLLHGYLCRCAGDAISLTSCNVTRSGCYSNPCINGLCIEGLASYYCNCLPTWTGKLCSEKIVSACEKNPCSPGKCFQLNDPNIPFVCLCPSGQFGLSCRIFGYSSSTARVLATTSTTTSSPYTCNPFDSRICMNGGRCLQTSNDYRCLCKPGFTGVFCEMNINECASNPCQHGGVCYDLQASYICYCQDGSFRSQCLPRDVPTSTARTLLCPCRNGGMCALVGSQTCVCPNGFTGRLCEHLLTSGNCNGMQCSNGGTCYENSPGSAVSARCLCKSGFSGRFCETEYFRCQANGRFIDPYNCAEGKYFECIHYQQGSNTNQYGMLLSRSCPTSLRFNPQADRCDYAQNVKCIYP